MLGKACFTGFQLAIGQQQMAARRVRVLHGQPVVWTTPAEMVIANVEAFKPIRGDQAPVSGSRDARAASGEPAKWDH